MKIHDILREFVTPQAVAQDPGLEREKDVDVIFYGVPGRDWKAEDGWAALEEVLPAEYPPGSEKAQYKIAEVAKNGGAVVTNKPLSVAKKLVSTFNGYGIKSRIDQGLNEFAPGSGGGSGDYLRSLASAWYNGVFDTGSLPKGIKTQEDVERLLNRGIVCPDGKTRKLHIDYNSDFDGVEIYSDDYYEHGDLDGNDGRTGQPWGPYDHMEFKDEELDEGVAENIALAGLNKEFGKFTRHFDRMDQDPAYAAKWNKQNTDRLNQEVPDDDDMMGATDISMDMGQDSGDNDEEDMREGNLNTKYSLKNMFGDVKSLDNLSREQLNKAMDGRVNIIGRKFRGQEGNSFRYDVKLDNGNSYIMHIIYVHGMIDAWLTDEENNKIPLGKVKPQGVAEGKPREKEADYGPDYQDMVARVKKLAGLGPLKTVWDPQKRVYKNVPRAEQPRK